jgi:hypothetical protein
MLPHYKFEVNIQSCILKIENLLFCYQLKILQSRQNVASMLNKFIKINDRNPVPAFVFEEHLQLLQFIERSHISQNQIKIAIIPSN